MKRVISFILLLFLFSISVYAGPKYELSETGFNFGKTVQHVKVSHTFWIRSTGDAPLHIEEIDPSCGCTQVPLSDSIIAPGDSAALQIILSTKSYRGYVSKRPNFMTNASEEKVYIRIDAELMPKPVNMTPISFSPLVLDVSQFTEKVRRTGKFLIENKYDRDFNITLIDVDNKSFDVEIPEKVKAGETVECKVVVHDDAVEKNFEESITIEIDDDFRSRFSLPVRRLYRILEEK